jgi:hypothetical protein
MVLDRDKRTLSIPNVSGYRVPPSNIPRDRGGRRGSWRTAGRHESRIDADLRGSCDAGERANLRSASGRARALRGCERESGTGTSRRRGQAGLCLSRVPVHDTPACSSLQPACTTAGDPRTSASRVLPLEARPSLRRDCFGASDPPNRDFPTSNSQNLSADRSGILWELGVARLRVPTPDTPSTLWRGLAVARKSNHAREDGEVGS